MKLPAAYKKLIQPWRKVHNCADDFFVLRGHDSKKPCGIAFDVALTVTKNQKDKAGFFVALATMAGGPNTEKAFGGETAHRIKFEVGLVWDYK